jgi:TatA/E family protein of Tat protein translocase
MIGSLGWTEFLLITAVVIIFLGKGNQLPEITRALGEAVREFKKAADPNRPDDLEDTETEPSDESDEDPESPGA